MIGDRAEMRDWHACASPSLERGLPERAVLRRGYWEYETKRLTCTVLLGDDKPVSSLSFLSCSASLKCLHYIPDIDDLEDAQG